MNIYKCLITLLFTFVVCVSTSAKTYYVTKVDAKPSFIKPIVIGADTSKVHIYYIVVQQKNVTPKYTNVTAKNDSIKKKEITQNENEVKNDINHFFKTSWHSIGFIFSIIICMFLMGLILSLFIKFFLKYENEDV